jgi:hypothetical protein
MIDDQRLERIEKKLDTLSDAVVSLARMEERMITLFKRMDSYDETQREIGKRVGHLEKSTNTNGQMLRFAERLFWIIASSVVAYFALKLKGGQ